MMPIWTRRKRHNHIMQNQENIATTKPCQVARLPPEICGIIIDYALSEVRYPHLYCGAENFARFLACMNYPSQFMGGLYRSDWKHIRLVCRAWRYFAGDVPRVRLNGAILDAGKTDNPLDHPTSIIIDSNREIPLPLSFLTPEASCNLSTIFLGQGCNSILRMLVDNYQLFPRLQCLSIFHADSSVWQEIQDKFPQLVTVVIQGSWGMFEGRFTLQNLRVLDIGIWFHFELICPSLKHLSIRYGMSTAVNKFLLEHGDQLESFDSCEGLPFVRPPGLFWKTFPNLKMLGKRLNVLLTNPPSGHPLRHLQLHPPPSWQNIKPILEELARFPQVTHLHLWSKDWPHQNLVTLKERCAEVNVTVVETSWRN